MVGWHGMTIAQKQTLSDLEANHLGTRTPAEKMKDRTCSRCFHPYYPIEMAISRYTVLQNWPCDLGGCVQGHGHEQGLQRYYFASCWVANRGAKCEKYRKMLQTVVSSFIRVQMCSIWIHMFCKLYALRIGEWTKARTHTTLANLAGQNGGVRFVFDLLYNGC